MPPHGLIPGRPTRGISALHRQSLSKKRIHDPAKLHNVLFYAGKNPVLKVKGKEHHLQPVQEPAVPLAAHSALNASLLNLIKKYEAYYSKIIFGLPIDIGKYLSIGVDHRSSQTAVRDQGNRGTCVAHASMAAMESAYKRGGKVKDLSENDAYNVFMATEASDCLVDPGIQTWKAGGYLTSKHVCTEAQEPYVVPKGNAACKTVPAACSSHRVHGFSSTTTFFASAFGGTGTHLATNTAFLESLLNTGHDVVLGIYVAGNDWNDGTSESGVVDVERDSSGNPAPAYGGHAMLLVGYNASKGYFIFKNSWGATRGHLGYFYLSYEYLQTYAKYGFVVLGVTPA